MGIPRGAGASLKKWLKRPGDPRISEGAVISDLTKCVILSCSMIWFISGCAGTSGRDSVQPPVAQSDPHLANALRIAEEQTLRQGVEMLFAHPSREAAVDFMEHAGPRSQKKVANILWELFERESGGDRLELIDLLGDLGETSMVPRLIVLLEDREGKGVSDTEPARLLRVAALMALSKIGDKSAIVAVVKLLSDDEPSLRAGAATVIGSWGDRSNSGRIVALLHDKEPAVRQSAVLALAGFHDKRLAGYIASLLDDEQVSPQAALALGMVVGQSWGIGDVGAARSWWVSHKMNSEYAP